MREVGWAERISVGDELKSLPAVRPHCHFLIAFVQINFTKKKERKKEKKERKKEKERKKKKERKGHFQTGLHSRVLYTYKSSDFAKTLYYLFVFVTLIPMPLKILNTISKKCKF